MGCLYSKMSRDSDDQYEKITDDDIDLATSADVASKNDVVSGPRGKSDILDFVSSKDLEDGQQPNLDRERQDDAAKTMQVLKDVTRAQLEDLRRARDRLFKACVCQEARQVARAFREAASAEVAQQPSLTDDETWLAHGGEGWEEEMTSFLTTEVEMLQGENDEKEGGQHPNLDRERQDDAAKAMQVLKDVTRAQLEELRRARNSLFKACVRQEARQVAKAFREAASAEVAQQLSLIDDATWLTPGGEGWEEEMASFLTADVDMLLGENEEVVEVKGGKEEEEEKERKGEMGDCEGVPSSVRHEALLVANMIRQSPNIDMNSPNEDEEEYKKEKNFEKGKKGEVGAHVEVQASFEAEALRVADMIRQSPTINPNQDAENIDENTSSLGYYGEEILNGEQTSTFCQDEKDSAHIFLDGVIEAVGFMAQESALLNERAFLNKKIAYMQMLVLRRAQTSFIKPHGNKKFPLEIPPSHAGQTRGDVSPPPYQTLQMNTGGDDASTSHHGDLAGCTEEEDTPSVMTSSTEDWDDVLEEREDGMEDDIDGDRGRSSARVFLDWVMGEVEAQADLNQRLLAGRVPSQSHGGIPAFPGTSGMTWDEALKHIHREDVRRGREEEEKRDSEGVSGLGLRRVAVRNSWLFKLILQLDAEDEAREEAVRCQTMSVSRKD